MDAAGERGRPGWLICADRARWWGTGQPAWGSDTASARQVHSTRCDVGHPLGGVVVGCALGRVSRQVRDAGRRCGVMQFAGRVGDGGAECGAARPSRGAAGAAATGRARRAGPRTGRPGTPRSLRTYRLELVVDVEDLPGRFPREGGSEVQPGREADPGTALAQSVALGSPYRRCSREVSSWPGSPRTGSARLRRPCRSPCRTTTPGRSTMPAAFVMFEILRAWIRCALRLR